MSNETTGAFLVVIGALAVIMSVKGTWDDVWHALVPSSKASSGGKGRAALASFNPGGVETAGGTSGGGRPGAAPAPLPGASDGPRTLVPALWDEYALARAEIPGWSDMGTYNPASRLPSGKPSDHAHNPADAFDAGVPPSSAAAGWEFFRQMIGRAGVHYVIFKDKIWSREQGLHAYTYGGHDTHVHVSGIVGYQQPIGAGPYA